MQIIEQHPYVDQVLDALTGDNAVGESLADDVTLEFLEDEIMKVGSLAHNDIDWAKVESESLKLLTDRSKHLKVLGFLLMSLQRGGSGERFALSLYLMSRVLDSWWSEAWPYPGGKGARARNMMFSQMLQRAEKGLVGLVFDGGAGDGRGYCLTLLESLIRQAGDLSLPDESLFDLKRGIEKLPSAEENKTADRAPSPEPAPDASAQPRVATPAASTATLGALTLDPGNERATRQSLLKVAEMLTTTEPGSPLGYRVRRYAIWLGITSTPPTRDGRRTDLAAISADRVSEYRETLEKSPDLALWQRIEQSLSVSPFWLDGHWLSARVAASLGYDDCAEAVREGLRGLLDRLPQLSDLTFNNGTPFLGGETEEWLWAAAPGGSTGEVGASPWERAYEQARELLSQSCFKDAMKLMESGLTEAREPRDRFYWRLSNARLLREAGMSALAGQQMDDLRQQASGRLLEDWEPALIKQLERLA
ncbi:type VI secretion system protein TssA [Marinobacter salinexigens]|uniref:Type VI secretion system protein TssA n=1 Tax=Marinobacter salinexigens TaxID=2919747 RepID=A0A5B0VFC2_9GAMM|nr:type VI secretion system protein TssA [Marinobacter salinexigens]KAA1172701.1 type VI secretion system protein TssA [Marinobacter salinexigens]